MVPEREQQMIQSPKSMVTVAWNTSGFRVLAALPKGAKFNASYHTNEILEEIRKRRDAHRTKRTRSLIVHPDNARRHTARASLEHLEANGMEKAPHPPYSPDLTPLDFFLFGHVKRMVCGCAFGSSGEPLSAVGGIKRLKRTRESIPRPLFIVTDLQRPFNGCSNSSNAPPSSSFAMHQILIPPVTQTNNRIEVVATEH
jgi:hypothetical protein